MQRVAVLFGGHGFIGSHLARKLASSGQYERIVCADIAAEPRFRTAGVDYMFCDVREKIADDLAFGATEIYNLAAVHTTPGHEDYEYFWTNIRGATHVCDYARRAKVETIVFTSSISVYGASEREITEDTKPQPDSAYGRSKLCAEGIHQLWRDEDPTRRRLIVARPAVIFGYAEKGNFTRLAKLLKRGLFFYSGRKDTIKACGYVKDLIESFEFFLSQPVPTTTYNFAYTERLTIEAICAAFAHAAGYRMPTRVLPKEIMLLAGGAFEILGAVGVKTSINRARVKKLFYSTNVVPKWLDASGFARKFDLRSALVDWKQESRKAEFD